MRANGLLIAIDGTAGTGKSSVGLAVAAKLGYGFLSTGEMYRALAYKVFEKGIDPASYKGETPVDNASAAGRGYAVAGGVSSAIEACLHEYYPDVEVHIEHAEGLTECKKMLTLAKAGKLKGCMIEGMGCPGGCMAGAGTNAPLAKAAAELKNTVPNLTIKYDPELTPDGFMEQAIRCSLICSNPVSPASR